ncbi:MAG: TonB-dependent receptor domain-containing protein [Wenzhouxiangella sp.]
MNQNHRNPLASAISYALGAGMVAGLAFTAAPVIAQDDEDAALDRIQVTGSRIQRTDVESTSPLLTVSREAILASGLQNVGDVLRNLNQADSLGLTNLTSSTNANDGTQTISLRGLGAGRTLVLVDGRRWLALGGGGVDTTQIPTQVIERIEILGDGASAVYGSDAIAGVINIILRDDFEGMEVDLFYGETDEGDGENTVYSFTTGHRGDRGNLIFNITRNDQEEIAAGDRSISQFPVAFVPEAFGSAFGRFGIFNVPGGPSLALNPANEQPGLAPGDRSPEDFIPFGNATRFNFAPTNFLLTPSTRLSAFTRGTFDITDDIQFFGQFTYNQRKSRTEIAPVPLTGGGFGGPQWNFPISGDSVFNPFDVDIPAFGFRMPGNRTNIQDFDTYFGTFGLQGDFDFADRPFNWDVAYSRGESSRSSTGENFVNLLRLQQGVGPSFLNDDGIATCGTPENPTPFLNGQACVPVNFFNGVSGLTDEMLNFVDQGLVQKQNSGLTEWQINLSGELFDLPAGPVGFAIGGERRRNTWQDQPDSTILAGINSTNFREPTQGSQLAEEGYFELAIPLLANVPAFQYLELSVAGRFSDFENEGLVGEREVKESFTNESFKFGLRWNVFDDLMLRGNYSETFRAPSVNNLFQGGSEGFPGGVDPCTNAEFAGNPYADLTAEQQARCISLGVPEGGAPQQTSQIRGLFGGNPNLQPEEGETKTIGVVYNPAWADGLDLALDFWDVKLDDALSGRGIGAILNGCIRDGELVDCGFITRGPTGEISEIRSGQFNLASIRIKGYDFNGNYRMNTDTMGRFALGLNATYTSSAKLTTGALSEAADVVGRAQGAFGGPTWRWRANASLNWNFGDFGLTYTLRYLHSLTEDCRGFEGLFDAGIATRQLCSDPENLDAEGDPFAQNNVGSVTYHDISGTYETPWNSTIRAGVRNLFQKDPPFMVSPFANSFDQAYDNSSFWFVSYNQRF